MRVLMLNNEFPPLGGGQGVFNELLLCVLAANHPEISIDLVTSSRAAEGYSRELFASNIQIYRVPVNNLDLHHARGIELLRYAARALRTSVRLAKEQRYDLCMAYSAVPAGPVALYLKKLFGIPYITRSPGVDIPGFEARYKFLYPILSPIIRRVWRGAEKNIVSSEMHAKLMIAADPSSNPVVIPNGVDTELFHPPPERNNAISVILCVARLVKRKGVHVLLQAFAKLHTDGVDARLVIVGTGDEEENLKALADKLKISAQVDFRGVVARDEMPELYRNADIFVLPSENEGMSNAALEALASGLPLVLTDVGGAAELIAQGENGLVVPRGEVEKLTVALRKLLSDLTLRCSMGIRSRKLSEQFSAQRMVDRYIQLINISVLDQSLREGFDA